MSNLEAALAGADENYLITFANKGLYKRAQKELESAGAVVSVTGEQLQAVFADGTKTSIQDTLQNYTCTCPSRSVCKHVLLAILAWQAQSGSLAPAKESAAAPPAPADYSPIYTITPAALEKLTGKKAYAKALLQVQIDQTAEVETGSILSVTLISTGMTVRFLPGQPPESGQCSCKSQKFCQHKAEAILHAIAAKQGHLPKEYIPDTEAVGNDANLQVVPFLQEVVEEIFARGLARMPPETANRFLQLATICHGARLATLERYCSRIHGHLEFMEKKSAQFSTERLISDLARVYQICQDLSSEQKDPELIGHFHDDYLPTSASEFYGLGAYQWHSTGGYSGITTLFFAPELQNIITYTSALPDDRTDAKKLYEQAAPWGISSKLRACTHVKLKLWNAKLSGKNQLSSSSETTAQPQGLTVLDADELEPIRYQSFRTIADALWADPNQQAVYALIAPARFETAVIDAIHQTYSLKVYDMSGTALYLHVKYEASTRLLIENLKYLEEKQLLAGASLFVRTYVENCRLLAFPVTYYGERTLNLSLDSAIPKQQKKTKSYFSDLI